MDCKNNIDKIVQVQKSMEFYYSKLQILFIEFENFKILDNEVDELILALNMKPFSFQTFLDNNQQYSTFLLMIGQIIAMSDTNGYKSQGDWNLYDDKRILAKANVRQNIWAKNLLLYKKNKKINDLTASIANALSFIKNPKNNLTQLSENHREQVSRKLLKVDYNKETYFSSLNEYFSDLLKQYELKNEQNLGLLISLFLYCDEIKEKWIENKKSDKERKNKIAKDEINSKKKLRQPLNQILYGPPGTGKTYNTINKALEIIFNIDKNGKTEDEIKAKLITKAEELIKDKEFKFDETKKDQDREKFKVCFDYFSNERQIEFVTFHQSYGYEEFVEGIKAETEKDNIKYEVQPGVFKKLCKKAQLKDENNFDQVYSKLIQDIRDCKEEKLSLHTKTGKEFEVRVNSNNNLNLFTGVDKNQQGVLTKENILKTINNEVQFEGWDSYFNGVVEYLNNKYNYSFNAKNDNNNKNYILIIDEINRGNISKIFGELITLIEPSKRINEDEEIRVKLPYSGDTEEPFGVPSNLYIIGTMNTADRSIAPIDTALRRRFEFIEMPPKPKKLDENLKGINLQKLLTAINTRIEYIYDRDHTIGHSYLLNIESLADLRLSFKNNILPLLAEYFYEDWRNIKIVLNEENIDGFIQSKKTDKYLPTNKNGKVLYEFKNIDDFTENDFKRIYGEDVKVVANEQEPTT